jgi:hypothetical protein
MRSLAAAASSLLLLGAAVPLCKAAPAAAASLPRTSDGKPNLQGIWQAHSRAAFDLESHDAKLGMPASRGVVEGGDIPYQPWAAEKRAENFAKRQTADPLANCFLPGVPRLMYMEFPFHIFQMPTQIAILFEWSQVFRLIYTDGTAPPPGIDFWMGDSRGLWEGDTLVVSVTSHNDKTWFDMAGNFHSDALRVVERYTMTDADTIQYGATIEDPKVFTRPWTIALPLTREKALDRVLEYQCNAEAEEQTGAFPREPRTWYRRPGEAR